MQTVTELTTRQKCRKNWVMRNRDKVREHARKSSAKAYATPEGRAAKLAYYRANITRIEGKRGYQRMAKIHRNTLLNAPV